MARPGIRLAEAHRTGRVRQTWKKRMCPAEAAEEVAKGDLDPSSLLPREQPQVLASKRSALVHRREPCCSRKWCNLHSPRSSRRDEPYRSLRTPATHPPQRSPFGSKDKPPRSCSMLLLVAEGVASNLQQVSILENAGVNGLSSPHHLAGSL